MKRYLLGLLIVIGCFGQSTGANVVASFAVSSRTLLAGAFASYTCSTVTCAAGTVIQNIGQTNHQVTVNATTGAYDGTGRITCNMEGSVNGTNWFNIGIPANPLIWGATAIQVKCNGFGSYPYLRVSVSVQALTAVAVTFSALYEGNSIPSNTLVDLSGAMTNMRNRAIGPLVTGGVPTTLITSSSSSNAQSLYSLLVVSDATGSNLVFGCWQNGVPTDADQFVVPLLNTVPTLGPLKYPLGMRPLITCKPGNEIYYQLTGTPVVTVYLHFRNE